MGDILPRPLMMMRMMGLMSILLLGMGLYYVYAEKSEVLYAVLITDQAEEEIAAFPVNGGDLMELSWIHSVEKTPWIETYQVKSVQEFLLVSTAFASYGAGVPHEANEVRTEDGMIIYESIDTIHEDLRWIHSHQAEHTLFLNGKKAIPSSSIPHLEAVRLYLEWR